MGAALKKDVDYKALSYLKWAAWGVIDIEKLERMQRRNYINHVRQELKLHDLQLECGGSATWPYYRIYKEDENKKVKESFTSANVRDGAFAKVCGDALALIEPHAHKPEPHNE